jgi:hypothetical protein
MPDQKWWERCYLRFLKRGADPQTAARLASQALAERNQRFPKPAE